MHIFWYILGIAVFALALTVSVAFHEFGHMITGKLFGVKVTEFMIGFGPKLWSKRVGETEYGLKAIPAGGYTALIGMYPPTGVAKPYTGPFAKLVRDARAASDETIGEGEDDRTFYRLPVWKRLVVMVAGIFANLLLAAVLFAVLIMGIGQVQPTTTIDAVSRCVHDATSSSQACAAGDPVAPGAEAGLRAGDRVVAVDGTRVASWSQMQQLVQGRAGQPTRVVIERDGQRLTLTMTPQPAQRAVTDSFGQPRHDAAGKIRTETVGFIGITPAEARTRGSLGDAMGMLWQTTSASARVVVQLPVQVYDVTADLVTGRQRSLESPMSIVGVGRVAGEVASDQQVGLLDKVAVMLSLTASLNIALMLFNLVPLVPLDGGHAFGALWEGVRRRWARWRGRPDPGPFDAARLTPLTIAVVGVLIAMTVLLVAADLFNPVRVLG